MINSISINGEIFTKSTPKHCNTYEKNWRGVFGKTIFKNKPYLVTFPESIFE